VVVGTLILSLAFLAAGCGGNDDEGATGGATTAAGSTTDSCVQEATAAAEAAKAEKDFSPPAEPFDMSANKGKSVWIIAASLAIPFNANQAKGSEEAAKVAGMKPTVFDGKGNVTSWNAGVNQAVGQGADGIILQGVDPKLVSAGVAKAEAAGIPVVDTYNGHPDDPLHPGVVAHVTSDYTQGGRDLASWVLADSKCQANTLVFGAPAFAVEVDIVEGFMEQHKKLCPSCKVQLHDLNDFSQLGTELFSETQSAIRREPDLNYIFGAFDATVTYILPAIEQSKADVKVVSHDGVKENLDFVRQGKQAADGAIPPLEVSGWAGIDQIGRAMADQPVEGWTVLERLVDTASIPQDDDAFAIFPSLKNYQETFKQLWQIQG
jgi:ribose transport system substrate-binding protein